MIKISERRRKICWLTADYFLDCDIQLIKSLSNYYDIHWHIVLPAKSNRYTELEINQWRSKNVTISIHRNKYRLRNPLSLLFYLKLLKEIKRELFEILYLNYTPSPFYVLATILLLKRSNVIVTAHQGQVHAGFKFKLIYQLAYRLFYSHFPFVNMFSKSEAAKFKKNYPLSTVFTIPLALKDFGESKAERNQDEIEFFNFGTIRPNKNIGLLIEAACELYEEGGRGFRVTIAGECDNWDTYKRKIKYPEIFNLIIRKIENHEISEMFCKYHYLVLPYSNVTQSGPLKIAYYYNVPVIASNLPGFSQEIVDNKTGFLFEPNSVKDLKRVMSSVTNSHEKSYPCIKQNLASYVEKEYSNEEILKRYLSIFETIEPAI